MRAFLLIALAAACLSGADDAATVRKEISDTYDRALLALSRAQTPADLDAVNRLTDTPDWVSIVNDETPRTWADLRPLTERSLGHIPLTAIRIVKFTLDGDKAVVIARVGSPKNIDSDDRSRYTLVRDTWVKTGAGWRRSIHEKPAPGKLDAELKNP